MVTKTGTCVDCGKTIWSDYIRCRSCSTKKRFSDPKNHPMYGRTGENHPMFGHKHTDKVKERMREAKLGEKNPMYGISLMREGLPGDKNPNWAGGIRRDKDGRVLIHDPRNPMAHTDGYVMRSRLVMSVKIGRILTSKELVHHINEIVDDDREENLELFDDINNHWNTRHKKRGGE